MSAYPSENQTVNSRSVEDFERDLRRHVRYTCAQQWGKVGPEAFHQALSHVVRDYCTERLLETEERFREQKAKRVHYLSIEFLMGQSLRNNLVNLRLWEVAREALRRSGFDLESLTEREPDAALGHGELGRLAACVLDSLATLGYAACGHGINYEHGLFKQQIENGCQRERPDSWLAKSCPWQIERPDEAYLVPVYGHVVDGRDMHGNHNPMWLGWKVIVGVPYDMPVVGHGGQTVNVLRLYSARASDDFDTEVFNEGGYLRAVEAKLGSEAISKVLYPSDEVAAGCELRLLQEYFLVGCSLRDVFRRFFLEHTDIRELPRRAAIHLSETHPALTVVELMRTLVDEHDLSWDEAWSMTQATLACTKHAFLPEALEKWPVEIFERVLPRHFQIVCEINRRFLDEVASAGPVDVARIRQVSLFEEGDPKQVRMAHLSIVGCHSVSGVSTLDTELVKTRLLSDLYTVSPEKFNNKTSGVTQRRWLLLCNPLLADLVTEAVGETWVTDLEMLGGLEAFADDGGFLEKLGAVKLANKERLAKVIERRARVRVNPRSLFDVQAQRIHEWKRQLLNVMNIVYEYLRIAEDGCTPLVERTHVFAGKASPGCWRAKEIIRLIHRVAAVVQRDSRSRDLLRVVFVPDYRVSVAEKIIPAADLSEQIATAGLEASGTSNMKFALNGALTVATLNSGNIQVRDAVGLENIYTFGLTREEVEEARAAAGCLPRELYQRSERVRRVVDALRSDLFCHGAPGAYQWILDRVLDGGDPCVHLADLESYGAAQVEVSRDYQRREVWNRKALFNIARMGKFSSDRTVAEYAEEIWGMGPLAAKQRGAPQPVGAL